MNAHDLLMKVLGTLIPMKDGSIRFWFRVSIPQGPIQLPQFRRRKRDTRASVLRHSRARRMAAASSKKKGKS